MPIHTLRALIIHHRHHAPARPRNAHTRAAPRRAGPLLLAERDAGQRAGAVVRKGAGAAGPVPAVGRADRVRGAAQGGQAGGGGVAALGGGGAAAGGAAATGSAAAGGRDGGGGRFRCGDGGGRCLHGHGGSFRSGSRQLQHGGGGGLVSDSGVSAWGSVGGFPDTAQCAPGSRSNFCRESWLALAVVVLMGG